MGPLDALYRDHWPPAHAGGALVRTFLESYVVPDKMTVTLVQGWAARGALTGLSDLVIKNTRIYAGAWVFDRTARHDDGQFEIVPFRGKRDWTSKAIVDLDGNPVTEAMLNEIGIEHSHPMRGSSFELHVPHSRGGSPLSPPSSTEKSGLRLRTFASRCSLAPCASSSPRGLLDRHEARRRTRAAHSGGPSPFRGCRNQETAGR